MAAASQPARGVRTARPAFFVEGTEDVRLSQGLKAMRLEESAEGMAHCEARFGNLGPKNNNIDFLYFDRKKLEFGKTVEIKQGDDSLFEGRISALEAVYLSGKPPEIVVLLEDRFQDLRMTRRTRSFENVSDADVMRRIASDHGLTAQVDLAGPTYKVISQINQSDLAFIRERSRSAGAELWMQGSTLNAKSRDKRTSTPLTLKYGGELIEFRVSADLSRQRTSVIVSGWDISAKDTTRYEATDQLVRGELDGGESGAAVLKAAFGDRKECVAHLNPRTANEARAWAEALFRSQARSFVSGWALAHTNGSIRVGKKVELKGLGPLFEGVYYISEIRTAFDDSGLKTEFFVEKPGVGKPS